MVMISIDILIFVEVADFQLHMIDLICGFD